MKNTEFNRLEKIAKTHNYNLGFNALLMNYRFKKIFYYIKNKSVLELGPAEGHMTEQILPHVQSLTVVDASKEYLSRLKNKLPNVNSIQSYFEEYVSKNKFDVILMMHILEHVIDPIIILKKYKKLLNENGKIIISVPNAYSFHRLLGVEMGLLKDVHELNELDLKVGHRRVYDWDSLEKDIIKAGLTVERRTGVFFKLFNNAQMNKLSKKQIEGLYKLGDKFPENCAEILFIVRK